MIFNIHNLKRKKSVLMLVIAFLLLTPLIVVSFSQSFDSRSKASGYRKVTSLSSTKYLHILSIGEFIMPNISVTPSNATSNDLVYHIDRPNIVKLVDDNKNPNKSTKLIVGLSEGDARISVSSKNDPSVKIIFLLHVVKRRALSLGIGESYDLNGYGVTKWKELAAPGNISLSETGVVTGKKRGVALVAGMNGDKELVRIYVGVDLLAKPTYALVQSKRDGKLYQGYMLKDTSGSREIVDTSKVYTSYQKIFLEDYLTQKVESVGGFGTRGGRNYKTLTGTKQGSRAGAVAAARFLALEFQYRIPYGNTDYLKKVYKKGSATERFDFGSWYNYADYMGSLELNYLYGYKINIHDANDNSTGKGCWGCATGVDDYLYSYTQGMFGGSYQKAYVKYHGLHCGTFVGWAMYNGGLNYMAGAQSLKMRILGEPEGYLPYKQPGAEYLHLFDKDNKVLNVTQEQWKKVTVGDLIYRTGHIGMIIGIDHKNKYMYVAHQTPDSIIVDRVNYMRPQNPTDFVGLPWQKIILMDKVYEKGGYISSMW